MRAILVLLSLCLCVFIFTTFSYYFQIESDAKEKKEFATKIDSLNKQTQTLYEELYFEKQEASLIKLQRDSLCDILDVKPVYLPTLYDLKGAKRLP